MIWKFKSQKGFFSIHFILFVSLISTTLVCYGFVFYAQKQKDLFRKVCYYDLAQLQKNLVRQEKQLFLLNPVSTALRLKLKILYAQLATAIATYNAALVARTSLQINQTLQSQRQLDTLQKSIITQSKIYIKTQLLLIQTELARDDIREKRIWSSLIKQHRMYFLNHNVIFAVQPDPIGGTAPNYELQTQYQALQKLSLRLQHSFETKTHEFNCTVTFIKKDTQWTLKINQDRPLLTP